MSPKRAVSNGLGGVQPAVSVRRVGVPADDGDGLAGAVDGLPIRPLEAGRPDLEGVELVAAGLVRGLDEVR